MKSLMKFWMIALAAVLTSCMMEAPTGNDEWGQDDGDTVSTDLTLTIPGGFSVMGTRALTDEQEIEVDEATVLLFDEDDLLIDVMEVSNISAGVAGATSLGVKLRKGTYNIVVVANANGIVDDVALDWGDSYADVQKALTGEITSRMFPTDTGVIPMWGQTGVVTVPSTLPTISLTRSIARVDIGTGAWNEAAKSWGGLLDFVMTEVYVISPSKEYSVIPADTFSPSADKFTVDQSAEDFVYTDISRDGTATFTTHSIYVPEVVIKGTTHENRTALVVGGLYDGSLTKSFYRVDFADASELMDIVRNHLYRFSIADVTGPGYRDVETAYGAASSNMTAGVIDWSTERVGDAHFYGDRSIVLSENPVEIGVMAGSSRTVSINTDMDWVELTMGANKLSTLGAKTVTTANYVYTLSGAGGAWSLKIDARANNFGASATSRSEVWAVNADDLIKFNFTVNQAQAAGDPTVRTVTVNSLPQIGAIASPTSATAGTPVKILARPSTGYEFDGWMVVAGGIAAPTGNPATFSMPAVNVELTPNYKVSDIEGQHAITVTYNAADGTAISSRKTANAGQTASLLASPATDRYFTDWTLVSGANASLDSATANPATLTVVGSGNVEVRANFAAKQAVNVISSAGGSASANVTKAAPGETVKVTAVPSAGYVFTGWGGSTFAPSSSANPATFTMPASGAATINATFVKQTQPVSVVPNNSSWGAPTFLPASPTAGQLVTIDPAVVSGKGVFESYTVIAGGVTISGNTFTMPAQLVSIRVNYGAIGRTVTLKSGTNGKMSAASGSATASSVGSLTAVEGERVTVWATPDSGYRFKSWTVGGIAAPTGNPATFSMPAVNVELTPMFELIPDTPSAYSVSVAPVIGVGGGSGKVSTDEAGISVVTEALGGTTVYFHAIPTDATTYRFNGWSAAVAGSTSYTVPQTNPSEVVVPTGTLELTPSFKKYVYSVSVAAGANGMASVKTTSYGTVFAAENGESDSIKEEIDEIVTYTATPKNTDYIFDKWTATGYSFTGTQATTSPLEIEMPEDNLRLTASFMPAATAPYIIYWDSTSKTMRVDSWNKTSGGKVTQTNMLYFKFGSVVGFTMTSPTDAWSADDVKFNTTDTASYTYANILYWNGSSTVDGYISSSSYHTLENVKAGRGDPCKLVGLTVEQIRGGTIDNLKYKMATYGLQQTEGWKLSGTQPGSDVANTSYGVENSSDTILPAAGIRLADGSPNRVGRNGYWWVSRASSSTTGYTLNWSTSVNPAYNYNAQYGFGVRCVPQ